MSPTGAQTIVSFLFPREHRDFLSFLVLRDVDEESGDEDEEDEGEGEGEEDEDEEGGDDVGVALLHGELGAD